MVSLLFRERCPKLGEKQVNGNWYNFRNDGTLSVGFVNVGNSSKYYDNAGRRQQGTFQVDKVTYETDSNGLITKASWNGVSYYCQRIVNGLGIYLAVITLVVVVVFQQRLHDCQYT